MDIINPGYTDEKLKAQMELITDIYGHGLPR